MFRSRRPNHRRRIAAVPSRIRRRKVRIACKCFGGETPSRQSRSGPFPGEALARRRGPSGPSTVRPPPTRMCIDAREFVPAGSVSRLNRPSSETSRVDGTGRGDDDGDDLLNAAHLMVRPRANYSSSGIYTIVFFCFVSPAAVILRSF